MAHRKTSKRTKAKTMLRLADLEQSKHAVLHSLGAPTSQESYGHAVDEFIGWYCSEPRLALNRTVVLRYRFFLEQKNLAPSTINVRLAAVRRLAYEASDTGLLSPELAAGIRRVKGAKCLGVRVGNWLTVDQSKTLLGEPPANSLRAVCTRWRGSFSRQRRMMRARSLGRSGRMSVTEGGLSRRIAETNSAEDVPSNGRRPAAISYSTTPSEKMSLRWSRGRPDVCSGACRLASPSPRPLAFGWPTPR